MSADRQDIDELADEYVLGLLDAADHAHVESQIEIDAALRAAVAASRDRFLALDLLAKPVSEPEGLWGRIAATLDNPASDAAAGLAPPAPANDNSNSVWAPHGLWRYRGIVASGGGSGLEPDVATGAARGCRAFG